MINRDSVVAHADAYWYRPCEDGKLWLSNKPIVIRDERVARKLSESEWDPVFLNYDDSRYIDGLYFVRKSLAQPSQLAQRQYYAPRFAETDLVQVIDWNGPNDCTHFVSECLSKGGVAIAELSVEPLLKALKARIDTKTLASFVDVRTAERIVTSGIMAPGDVIIFGQADKTFSHHGHAVLYMGNNQVANHTHLNHPKFNCITPQFGAGHWQQYTGAPTGHTLVVLVHFSAGDADPLRSPTLLGWWAMTWRNRNYYYFFDKRGGVQWTSKLPTNRTQAPQFPEGKGYWFQLGQEIKICWTETGNVEVYPPIARSGLNGRWNGVEPVVGTKLP